MIGFLSSIQFSGTVFKWQFICSKYLTAPILAAYFPIEKPVELGLRDLQIFKIKNKSSWGNPSA